MVADAVLSERDATGCVAEWAAPVLRRAAHRAATAGDLARASTLLNGALSVRAVSVDQGRVEALIELGRVEASAGVPDAKQRWHSAADLAVELPPLRRIAALVALGEATYASGAVPLARQHFTDAYDLAADVEVDDETMARVVVGLSAASLLTGRRHDGVAARLSAAIEAPTAYPGVPTRALMAGAAGEVALGVDRPVPIVHRLIDGAVGDHPLPAAVLRPVVESLSAAMSLTGRPDAAVALLDDRLRQAETDHDLPAHVSLLPLRAHAQLLADRLMPARTDAARAIELIATHAGASGLAEAPARHVLARASLELDDQAAAEAACDVTDHRNRWGGTPMHGWFLDGAARVHAASHDHDRAVAVWREAAREFTLVGGTGGVCEWRDGLARSYAALGDLEEGRRISAEQSAFAQAFGDVRLLAVARATAAALTDDHLEAAHRLGEALSGLPRGANELTRCRLGWERGTRLRRAGRRRAARDQLNASLAIAARLGARRLVRLIGDELVAAGGARPGRSDGRLPLTVAEQEIAGLAADGLGNAEIARRRSVSRKTVEAQLSSVYRKLGISNRNALAGVLGAGR
ncbi:MAG: helix-turn-helix transcriptional regulator [Microthrixaceae bacterium]